MKIKVTPKFVAGTLGNLFIMQYEPHSEVLGSVIVVSAFAEEMNKSRRMFSIQARLLAENGFRVIVPDLHGTGDSDGDFGQANVAVWRNDLIAILRSDEQFTASPLWIWGHRLGALLAMDAAKFLPWQLAGAILWSPCCDGKRFMNQFMRIRSLTGMVSGSAKSESIVDIRESLLREKKVEVAGYEISVELVSAIDQMTIDLMSCTEIPIVHWFELSGGSGRLASPAIQRAVSALTESGSNIRLCVVEGPNFWATPEHSEAPNLLDATTRALACCDTSKL